MHIVYSTKHRQTWLSDQHLRSQLYAYNAAVLQNDVESPAIKIGGVEDHVHTLCWLSRNHAVKSVVQRSKTETAKWLKKQGAHLAEFQWQSGYGAFSVSVSNIDDVKRYIENQEQHHKQFSSKDEFRLLCEKHGIDIDERYVWD